LGKWPSDNFKGCGRKRPNLDSFKYLSVARKRRRRMDLTFVRRGIIQHLNLLSESWEERDLPRKEEEEKEGRKEGRRHGKPVTQTTHSLMQPCSQGGQLDDRLSMAETYSRQSCCCFPKYGCARQECVKSWCALRISRKIQIVLATLLRSCIGNRTG
jgi:hypothetical protein